MISFFATDHFPADLSVAQKGKMLFYVERVVDSSYPPLLSIHGNPSSRLTRHDTQQSFASTTSFTNVARSGSISARRNQLHRQNSFGVPPNKFLNFAYRIKELTFSTDSTDEKTASTVLVGVVFTPHLADHRFRFSSVLLTCPFAFTLECYQRHC